MSQSPPQPKIAPQHPFTTLSQRHLWQSPWYNLRQDQLRDPDGKEFTYTVVEKKPAVWVVPVTPEGHVVLINQYRYPIRRWCLEVPAGNLEPGHDPETMARRELREEIGGAAEHVETVGTFYTMNGISDEVAHIFLAWDVALGPPQREASEWIKLQPVPVAEAMQMARSGGIPDGPSALALLMCEAALSGRFDVRSK